MREYKTDSQISLCMDRVGEDEYNEVRAVRALFQVVKRGGEENICGNVDASFTPTGKARLSDFTAREKGRVASYEQISSALALYRTISLFECGLSASRCDFYKLNWEVIVKHKETGLELALGEWKGGFSIRTVARSAKELPAAYVRDVERLLTLLASPTMPIGYDGTIAGSIA